MGLDVKKSSEKIQIPFMINKLRKLGKGRTSHLDLKSTKKSTTNFILNGEQLEEGISKTVFFTDYMIVCL